MEFDKEVKLHSFQGYLETVITAKGGKRKKRKGIRIAPFLFLYKSNGSLHPPSVVT